MENLDFLSYNFATSMETPGRALVDTAAQHGLIGRETLDKLDQHLLTSFGMKVQHSGEDGGTVRGVCGAEERTPIAYIPIGIGGCSGLLRVQIVPGPVPCLIPAYLLTDMGSVIDMVGLTLFHTTLGVTQQMHRRSAGHVEVSITEYGRGFSMPEAASFGRSQVWSDQLLPTPIRIANAFDMRVPLEALLLALAIGGAANALMIVAQQPRLRDVRRLAARRERLERQVLDMQQKEAELMEASRRTSSGKVPMLNTNITDEIRKIQETFSHRIVPSRFILTKKQQEVGQSWKAKARWILLGHRDPDAQELERYAPTPATPTVYLTFQLLSSLRYRMVIMDVSSAFGQSDHRTREQGPLFATMPPSGIPGKEKSFLIRVLTAVYGLVDAPAMWRRTVRKVLSELGYFESTFDPSLYYLPFLAEENPQRLRGCAGLVLLDVDDFVQGGNPRHELLMESLRQRFRFGKWRSIYKSSGEYLGRTVYQTTSRSRSPWNDTYRKS